MVFICPNSLVANMESCLRNSICLTFSGLILSGEEFAICWNETSPHRNICTLRGKDHLKINILLRKCILSTKSIGITVPETSTVTSTTQVTGVFAKSRWEAVSAKCGLREPEKLDLSEKHDG